MKCGKTMIGATLATLGLAAVGGCGNGRGQRPAANATPAGASAATVRNADPPHTLDRTGARGETVYRVLGVLDEYAGRHVADEGDDVVEQFYCSEPALAATFGPLLERLAREQQIQTSIRRTTLQDCLPVFHSPELRAAIVALYPPPAPGPPQQWTQRPDGRLIPVHQRFVHPSMFRDATAEQKWAYLSGVYLRHGRGDSVVFANAGHKADLVATLLRELGVRDVVQTSRNGIPRANIVTFTPDPGQRAKLGPSLRESLPRSARD